jgi:RNA polymerase sigma-70 factor (ECF subfamily)
VKEFLLSLSSWVDTWDGPAAGGDSPSVRDAQMVRAALEDPDAYRHIVQRYQARVFATSLRMVGNEADARDIAQEAFIRAYKSLPRFELGRPFGPWICTIAANLSRDHLRDPVRRFLRYGLMRQEAEAPERTGESLDRDERRDALGRRLLKLKPKLREALVLRYVSELSVEEVADALEISVSATKMRLKRGLERLERVTED